MESRIAHLTNKRNSLESTAKAWEVSQGVSMNGIFLHAQYIWLKWKSFWGVRGSDFMKPQYYCSHHAHKYKIITVHIEYNYQVLTAKVKI